MFCGTVGSGHIADCPIRPASLVTINIMELLDKTWQRETISSNKAAVTWPIVDTINYYYWRDQPMRILCLASGICPLGAVRHLCHAACKQYG